MAWEQDKNLVPQAIIVEVLNDFIIYLLWMNETTPGTHSLLLNLLIVEKLPDAAGKILVWQMEQNYFEFIKKIYPLYDILFHGVIRKIKI